MTLEQKAQALYEAGQSPRPAWDILGDTTRSVWLAYAAAGRRPEEWSGPFPLP